MAEKSRSGGVLVEFRPMSPDEIERTVQFLLQQQAQFAADIATNEARVAELRDLHALHERSWAARTEEIRAEVAEETRQLRSGLVGLTSVVGHLASAQELTDRQLRTVEGHLDAVIQLFERHLREDHGSQPS